MRRCVIGRQIALDYPADRANTVTRLTHSDAIEGARRRGVFAGLCGDRISVFARALCRLWSDCGSPFVLFLVLRTGTRAICNVRPNRLNTVGIFRFYRPFLGVDLLDAFMSLWPLGCGRYLIAILARGRKAGQIGIFSDVI